MKKLAGILTAVALACLVFGLYCRWASRIRVELVSSGANPASNSENIFKNLRLSAQRGESGVELFASRMPDSAGECFFLTLTYRLTNYSPLSAEWITFDVSPESGDVVQVLGGEVDLGPFSRGDARVTLLVKNGGSDGPRNVRVNYYVLGRKMQVEVPAGP